MSMLKFIKCNNSYLGTDLKFGKIQKAISWRVEKNWNKTYFRLFHEDKVLFVDEEGNLNLSCINNTTISDCSLWKYESKPFGHLPNDFNKNCLINFNEQSFPFELSEGDDDLEKFYLNGWISFQIEKKYLNDIEIVRKILHEHKHSRMSNLDNKCSSFTRIRNSETIHNFLELIYGKDYHLTTFSSNTLRNSDGDKMHWHRDYPYHNMPHKRYESILGVQVNIVIDDFTKENGSTHYISGSHSWDLYPPNKLPSEVKKLEKQWEVPVGTIFIYNGALWHSQGVNKTKKDRSLLLCNYSPLSVPKKD